MEVQRADEDMSPSDGLMPSSLSLIHSTPSQSLSELISHILESSSSALSPPSCSGHLLQSTPHLSSQLTTTASSVNVVTSALGCVTLSDDVFIGTCSSSSSSNKTASSSEPMSVESSCSACSESVCSSNTSYSSDGIRGVWYYLSSSLDSSQTSLDTTMPASCTTSSSSYPSHSSSSLTRSEDTTSVTSPSIVSLSSDLSESTNDAEMTEGDLLESTDPGHTHPSDSSDHSNSGSDIIYIGFVKSASDPSGKETGNSQATEENDLGLPDHLSEGKQEQVSGQDIEKEVVEAEDKIGESGDFKGAAGAVHGKITVLWSTMERADRWFSHRFMENSLISRSQCGHFPCRVYLKGLLLHCQNFS